MTTPHLFNSLGVVVEPKSITGVVSDAAGEPIIGASVVEVGTTNGTITDIDGKFVLNLKSATPFPKCYLHKEKWTFDS